MTSDPALRLARLENETEAIYEMLTDIQATQAAHTAHLSRHDARFDQHDADFARVHTTLDEVLRRLPEQR